MENQNNLVTVQAMDNVAHVIANNSDLAASKEDIRNNYRGRGRHPKNITPTTDPSIADWNEHHNQTE
jgi:hypothetical protein